MLWRDDAALSNWKRRGTASPAARSIGCARGPIAATAPSVQTASQPGMLAMRPSVRKPDAHPVSILEAGPEWERSIASMFADLRANGDERWFHPFPLDDASARSIANASGRDLFLIAIEGEEVIALGMLRGWDEGFDTPSLGIAVGPSARGHGLGRAMMLRLHDEAQRSGSRRIRLTVDRANAGAVALYTSLGYALTDESSDDLTGLLELPVG